MGEWIKWEGGECPVHRNTRIDVRHRRGTEVTGTYPGDNGAFRWEHYGEEACGGGDIVAYRLSSAQGSTEEAYEDADRPVSESVLDEAARIVAGKRATDYGKPERNFNRIARFWSVYLDKEITPIDVCQMMILLKQARL